MSAAEDSSAESDLFKQFGNPISYTASRLDLEQDEGQATPEILCMSGQALEKFLEGEGRQPFGIPEDVFLGEAPGGSSKYAVLVL